MGPRQPVVDKARKAYLPMFTPSGPKPPFTFGALRAPPFTPTPPPPASTDDLEIARHVLEHAAVRLAVVEGEIVEAQKRSSRVSDVLLKQRERRNRELVAAAIKYNAAQSARAKAKSDEAKARAASKASP